MSEKMCPNCKMTPLAQHIPGRGWTAGCRCTGKIEFFPTAEAAIAAWKRWHT